MMDMFGKLNELKQKMEDTKKRLDTIIVEGNAGDGAVSIKMTGNQNIKSIELEDAMLFPERKEELTEMLEVAFNRALEKARNISETEMKAAGKGMLPNIPGLF